MNVTEKTHENRLRRVARRRGYHLTRSRRRDPGAIDYDRYSLVDSRTGKAVNPAIGDFIYTWTLDQAEAYLTNGKVRQRK